MKKIFTILVTIIFLVLIDIVISKYFTIYGIRTNVWLVYVLFVSLFIGHTEAVVLGFFCGIILDIMHMSIFGINTYALSTIGYLFGWLHKRIDESLSQVQVLSIFLGSVLYLILVFIMSKLFSISTSFSYSSLFIPFLDVIVGFVLMRVFIWYYEIVGII
jgi:rod shape-determining protein MreD